MTAPNTGDERAAVETMQAASRRITEDKTRLLRAVVMARRQESIERGDHLTKEKDDGRD